MWHWSWWSCTTSWGLNKHDLYMLIAFQVLRQILHWSVATSHFSSHDFIRFNWNNSFQLLHWHVYCLLFIIFYHHINSYHIIYIHLYIWYSTIFVDWFDPKIHFHLISHLRLLCNIVCIRNCILTIVGYIPIQSHQPLQVSIIFMAHIFSLVVHRFCLNQPIENQCVFFLNSHFTTPKKIHFLSIHIFIVVFSDFP